MSSTSTNSELSNQCRFPVNPEWKSILAEDLAKQGPVNFFSLATVGEGFMPRVRTLTFRGFLGEVQGENPTPNPNPPATSSILLTTSSALSQKFQDLSISRNIEALFWIPRAGAQWRIQGHAFVIAGASATGSDEMNARRGLGLGLEIGDEGEEWSWEKEVGRLFVGLDPKTKAKFEGSEISDNAGIPVSNEFRVIAIVPDVVEVLKGEEVVRWKPMILVGESEGRIEWVKSG